MYYPSSFEIDIKTICANIPYYSIRSIFYPSETGRILDRGILDWESRFEAKKAIQLPNYQFESYEVQTLIYAAECGLSIYERFMALTELKKRGYSFDSECGWINTSAGKCVDRETWKEKAM